MSNESFENDSAPASASPRKSRVLLTVLLFVLALAVLGGAIYYVGGVDYLMSSLGMGSSSGSGGSQTAAGGVATSTPPAVSASQLQLPPGVSEDLAKRMYVEQIQSNTNIQKMAAGDISRFDVTEVKATEGTASVLVKAFFKDGTTAPGVLALVKRGGNWFFLSFTGMRPGDTGGLADTVQAMTDDEALTPDAQWVTESGITEFDYGVMNTLVAAQVADQKVITGVIDRSLTSIALGTPAAGAGTTLVPADFTGKGTASIPGEAVMIVTVAEQGGYTFLVSFRTK
ncbi:MAG: hypothetical protein WCJ13_02475 [Coriobacteriia bacterium]